jgi:hypothetical protein
VNGGFCFSIVGVELYVEVIDGVSEDDILDA